MNASPAFPLAASEYGGNGPEYGMTLRDYFAAKAMQSFLTITAEQEMDEQVAYKAVATMSYRIADAMLAAREK